MVLARKHVDLEVPSWGEVALGPAATVFTLRPFGFRPEGGRPVPLRPTALLATAMSSASMRAFVFRSHLMRPLFFRPQGGAGRATMAQSSEGSFPDRPHAESVPGGWQEPFQGIAVWMSAGVEERAIEHDVGLAVDVLHSRFMLKPGSVQGGSVVVMRGVGGAGDTIFELSLDGDTRQVTLWLSTEQTVSAMLVAGLAWYCVEVKLDTQAGQAGLWVNGLLVGSVSGSFGALVTRRLRLGAVAKDSATVGVMRLDEWVMDGSYIGPVTRQPVGAYADDPARWLVVYNTAVADSVAWVEFYRHRRGVPYANLVGLNLSTLETVDEAAWEAMRSSLSGYISDNMPLGRVTGVLIGYGVPGVATIGGVGRSVASLAADLGNTTADVANPLYVAGPVDQSGLPDRASLVGGGRYLVGECNAETRALAEALSDRADALTTADAGGHALAVLSPETDRLGVKAGSWSELNAWVGGVGYQQVRLAADESFDGTSHGDAIEFTDATGGALTNTGQTLALLASIGDGTADLVRSGTGLVHEAISYGYVFTTGHVGDGSSGQWLNPGALTAGLRADWSWGEAIAVATPTIHSTWRPIGDPLAKLRLPRAGWNIFGPLDQLEEMNATQPDLALREDEHSVELAGEDQPVVGDGAYYVVRHVDDLGRAESGTTLVRPTNVAGSPATPPLPPVWPDVEGWGVWVHDGQAHPGIFWDQPARGAGVGYVELLEQNQDGSTAVVATITPGRGQRSVHHPRPLVDPAVRYAWRVFGPDDGVVGQTPWSARVGRAPSGSNGTGSAGLDSIVKLMFVKES